ncbi:MAG: MerR family transcriptional regulator [Bacteriovoracaceae bacterium]|nr:MerR family transcriptional regulator [Bacteriovoracaceae bacterium]
MKQYNIHITSKMTGLSQHTLRAWEKRYSIVNPKRNVSKHRVYNENEVELLRKLNDLCSLGYSISQLKEKSLNELNELLNESGVETTTQSPHMINTDPVFIQQSLDHLLLALEGYRLDVLSHEFYNIKMKLSLRDLALQVISPLLGAVGRKIMEGTLTIAQEHALSSIIKFHLGQFIYKGREEKKRSGKLFVLTTPEGDYHEFGILLASLLCSHYNHNFFFLGPNMPLDSLIQASKSIEADEIILGTTEFNNSPGGASLEDYITKALTGIGKDKKLLVGGSGFFDLSKLTSKSNFSFLPSLNHLDHYLANT